MMKNINFKGRREANVKYFETEKFLIPSECCLILWTLVLDYYAVL